MTFLQNVDLVGNGESIGLSASCRVYVVGCKITGWNTGVLSCGNSQVLIRDSVVESNATGLHVNVEEAPLTSNLFNGNCFADNDTAMLLENMTSDVTLGFEETLFSHNTTDIDNRCGQRVDISLAILE